MFRALCLIALLATPLSAHALVLSPVGGRAGQFDANLRVSIERGLIEPNDNKDSYQRADWEVYTAGVGYTFGDLGPIRDVFARFEASRYESPAERNTKAGVPSANCLGTVIDATTCEFHPADQGTLLSPQFGFNIFHEPNFSWGIFLQGNIPIGVKFRKFVLPRTDALLVGSVWGVRFLPWLNYQSQIMFGTGPVNGAQNATFATLNTVGVEVQRWLLPWKAGFRFGPYVDADLNQRYDSRYDAAYFAGSAPRGATSVSSPADTRDRIRMFRFATSMSAFMNITNAFALEGGYTQKIFGYDTPATRFYTVGVRAAY